MRKLKLRVVAAAAPSREVVELGCELGLGLQGHAYHPHPTALHHFIFLANVSWCRWKAEAQREGLAQSPWMNGWESGGPHQGQTQVPCSWAHMHHPSGPYELGALMLLKAWLGQGRVTNVRTAQL